MRFIIKALRCANIFVMLGFLACETTSHAVPTPQRVSVALSATWSENPAQIVLHWTPDPTALNYTLSRKPLGGDSWTVLTQLPAPAISWTDNDVQPGAVYEYQVKKDTGIPELGYGYLCAAIRAPLTDSRGKVILLVEKSLADALPFGLMRLQQDLVGDGWTVIRHDVAANDSVVAVKEIIRADYQADPQNTKALLLFGHVPVPYSGFIAPDGHDDHRGAWPADVYYGEFDGQWTDSTVTSTEVASPKTVNIPGDGKFDQDHPPGPVRLQIGRVDLSSLTCFANKTFSRNEIDLARQYLNKDHAFRHNQLQVPRRALLFTHWGGNEDEPASATALRNFPGFFGNQMMHIGNDEFLPTLNSDAYLWTYATSSGSMYACNNAATSDELALNDPKTVFTSFLGSYFGDWDRESNFLRAVLGTTTHTLTTFYGGQPQWILHPMSLGAPIGEAARLTQNNKPDGLYPPHLNFGVGQVHISLLGDPTLRLHPVTPPSGLVANSSADGIRLAWNASSDTAIVGYHVYRSSSTYGPFARISPESTVTETTFLDPSGHPNHVYMVRAIKLEETPAGSYYNASQGIFVPDPLAAEVPLQITSLLIGRISPGAIPLNWSEKSGAVKTFQIERRTDPDGSFQVIASLSGIESAFTDRSAIPGVHRYRIKAIGFSDQVAYSEEKLVNLQTPFAGAVGIDRATGGNWTNTYGQDGYLIVNAITNLPPYLTVIPNEVTPYTYDEFSQHSAALVRPNGEPGIIAFWAGPYPAHELHLRFDDSTPRRVSIYMIDITGTLVDRVEALDPFSGTILSSLEFNQGENGAYVTFDIQNYATIRITPVSSRHNPGSCGIFISPAPLPAPVIYPEANTYFSSTTVSMRAVSGATIRYTSDNSDPSESSPIYTQPFTITSPTTVIKARAFQPGLPPSPVTARTFTNTFATAVANFHSDTATAGDWQKHYGDLGYLTVGGPQNPPSAAEVSMPETKTYTWSDSATEMRALNQYSSSTSARLASCWYSETDLTLGITMTNDQPVIVALYFLDWDRQNRVQDVIITDPNGLELHRQRIDGFHIGKYYTFKAQGDIRIQIKRIVGPNAVLNGIFLGAAPTPPPPPPPPPPPVSQEPASLASALAAGGSQISIRIQGEPGQTFDIEHTSDFQTWTLQIRRTLTTSVSDWSTIIPQGHGARFYRATLVPP